MKHSDREKRKTRKILSEEHLQGIEMKMIIILWDEKQKITFDTFIMIQEVG